MRDSLPALAISRPITTVMAVITLLALGTIAFTRLPLEYLSTSDTPFLSCWIPYQGATPEQIEKEVAIPAEGEFLTIPKITSMRSYSHSDGCFVFMRFEWGTDMSAATAEVRDRIERLRLRLPEAVDRLQLRRYGQEEWSVIFLGLFGGKDEETLALLARKHIQPRLARIDGVAEVSVFGGEYVCVYIEFDQNALLGLDLNLYQIILALRDSGLNLSLGKLYDGGLKYHVRSQGEFTHESELANLVVGPNSIRLKDVANVSLHTPPRDYGHSMDGRQGVFIQVKKESQARV